MAPRPVAGAIARRLVPVAIAALVLLSGCTGALDDGTTQTPEVLDPAEADLPPGVDESGVANATALVMAHDETLRAKGFVLNGTFVRDPPNAGNRTRRFHTVVGPGAERFTTDVRTVRYGSDAPDAGVAQRTRTHIWGDGMTMLRRSGVDGNATTGAIDEIPPYLSLTRAAQYRTYLELGDYSVDRVVARGGHTYTTLVATGPSEEAGENTTFAARLVVDERGVVHEGVVDVGTDGRNGKTDNATYRVVRLGASPERPAWAETADGG